MQSVNYLSLAFELKHLFSTYLAEFIWRYMHRDEDLFSVFLNDVKKVYATSTTKR